MRVCFSDADFWKIYQQLLLLRTILTPLCIIERIETACFNEKMNLLIIILQSGETPQENEDTVSATILSQSEISVLSKGLGFHPQTGLTCYGSKQILQYTNLKETFL